MHKCSKCLKLKAHKDFNKHPQTLSGLQSWCKTCERTQKNETRKLAKLELIRLFGGKCVGCGYNRCHASLDFHHRDPSTKVAEVSQILRNGLTISTRQLKKPENVISFVRIAIES